MRILKTVGIVILGIIAILMIASVFMPTRVHIERDIIINAQKELIFQQVNNLENWKQWAPWMPDSINGFDTAGEDEPNTDATTPTDDPKARTSGTTVAITRSVPFEVVEMDIEKEKWQMKGAFRLEVLQEGVRAIWSIDAETGKKPFRKYSGLFFNKYIGDQLEEGLLNLKNLAETNTSTI